MDDLFSDTSLIDNCGDDCLLKLSSGKNRYFFIKATTSEILFSIPPAYEPEVGNVLKSKTLEEKSTESEVKDNQEADKWVQTNEVEMRDQICFADLPPTFREADYEESALERILRHMSAYLHRTQLQQWLSTKPERNTSFSIRPVQASNIFQSCYNEQKATFVLLLSDESSQYFIELRSLKNLLKSIDRKVEYFKEDDRLKIFSSQEFVVVFSTTKILVMDFGNMDEFFIFETSTKVVSFYVHSDKLHYIDETGNIYFFDGNSKSSRLFNISPLLCPVLNCSVISEKFYSISSHSLNVFNSDFPFDYESYECEMELHQGPIVRFGSEKLVFFNRKAQICYVWEEGKPKAPSHQLIFGSNEHTIDVACDEESIYTLTSGGVISVWKLRPNGRKYRDRLFPTFLQHCAKFLLAFPDKFVIQTHTQVHFLIFGASEDSAQGT